MSKKLILVAVVVAAGLLFAVVPKVTSTADAASGSCYSGDTGPPVRFDARPPLPVATRSIHRKNCVNHHLSACVSIQLRHNRW